MKKPSKDWKENKPLYQPVISSNTKKKGMVYVKKDNKKRLIHFGDSSMKDFRQHKDPKRRANYLARSAGITKMVNGKKVKTANDKNSANYYSRKYLW